MSKDSEKKIARLEMENEKLRKELGEFHKEFKEVHFITLHPF